MSGTPEIFERCLEIDRMAALAKSGLDQALAQAWEVGRRLLSEQRRVRKTIGRSAWTEWLRLHCPKTPEIARRYMRLAEEHASPDSLSSLSVREAYFRLGISTEPKVRDQTHVRCQLAGHVRSSNRLLLAVRRRRRRWSADEEDRRKLCRDLKPLYQQMNALFAGAADHRTANDRPTSSQ